MPTFSLVASACMSTRTWSALPSQLVEDRVDLGERGAPGAQEDVALEVDHAEAHAVALDDALPWPGCERR